jgi:dihydroorotase
MKYLIKNGHVVDPANDINEKTDVLISDSKIEKVAKNISDNSAKVIDAKDKMVCPGFVDMHVHLREPGLDDKETLETGTDAALAGGFTTVVTFPNTMPVLDTPETINALKEEIKNRSSINILVAGAVTKGQEGKDLCDIGALKDAGAIALTDDGNSIADYQIMRLAIKQTDENEILLISHCEDKNLSKNGVMNEGFISSKLGLKPIPKSAEYEFIRRDLELAKGLNARIHIAHVSCKESCELIRQAKKEGVKVTAETAPHYFSLSEKCVETFNTSYKMNPPLRTEEDIKEIKKSLKDKTLDVIATDHAPHGPHDKEVEFDNASFGIIGLETSLSVGIMELIDTKVLDWPALVKSMSLNPAKILGIEKGTLSKGADADIVIIDPKEKYLYSKDSIKSKSKNSPFIGKELKGKVTEVFVGGKKCL